MSGHKILTMLRNISPYVFFAIITLLIFGNTLFLPSTKLLSNGDLMGYDYYILSFLRQSLARGEFPLWNPQTFSGVPFLANPYMNLFYLPKWMLVVLPLTVSFSWYMAIHIWLAMSGMYWFLKRYLHQSSSIVGALAFGLSGQITGHIFNGNIDIISASAWMPITMGAIFSAVQKPNYRKTVIAGVICTIQLISGYQTMTLFILQTLSILMVIMAIVKRSWVPLILFPVIITIGVGLSAIQLIPTTQLVNRSIRTYPKNADWYYYASFKPKDLPTLVAPYTHGQPKDWIAGVGDWNRVFYIGIVPLSLALFGAFIWYLGTFQKKHLSLFGTKENWLIPSLFMIALTMLWISFGNTVSLNLQGVLNTYLPWYRYIRSPWYHLSISSMCLAIIAAFGLESIRRIQKRWTKVVVILAIILTSLDLVLFGSHFMIVLDAPDKRTDHTIVTALQNDTYPQNRQYNHLRGLDALSILQPNSPLEYNQYSASGYDISGLRSYYSFINATNRMPDIYNKQEIQIYPPSQAINFLNIQYVLYPGNIDLNYPVKLYNIEKNYKLYDNPNVLPRFFIVPKAVNMPSQSDAYDGIVKYYVDLSQAVVFINQHNLPQSNCKLPNYNGVTVTDYRNNSITLRTDSPCDGWLVSSEVMFPGWHATIDGKQTTLYEGNLAFRTIFIPAGQHTVIYRFIPSIYIWSAAVTLGTILLLIVIGVVIRRRNA